MQAKNPLTNSKEEIELTEFFRSNAEGFLRKLELAGKPETLSSGWPLRKAGFIMGCIYGGLLGFKLAMKLASLPEDKDAELQPTSENEALRSKLPS